MQPFRFAFFVNLFALYAYANVHMTSDFSRAKEIAQAYNLPMILLFTGSDWDRGSQKILHDIISKKEFIEEVDGNFIFVPIDFPEIDRKNVYILDQDQKLKNAYQVESFPLLIMIDSDGREISRFSYMNLAPEEYAKYLKQVSFTYKKLKYEIDNLDPLTHVEVLEKLFERAEKMGTPYYLEKIMQIGLNKDEGVVFPLERYARFVHLGMADCEEAQMLREKVIKRDPDNSKKARLRLALLDFQAHGENPEEALKPIGQYFSSFGSQDKEAIDKLHPIISEYFLHHTKTEKTKEFLQTYKLFD